MGGEWRVVEEGRGKREWREGREGTGGTAVSALTVSDESITHELTILAQSGGCHGHLTWTLTF